MNKWDDKDMNILILWLVQENVFWMQDIFQKPIDSK